MFNTDISQLETDVEVFYYASLAGKLDKFEFEDAFKNMQGEIRNKLCSHGNCTYDEFEKWYHNEYEWDKKRNDFIHYSLIPQTNYIQFTNEDVLDAVLPKLFERLQEAFLNTMEEFSILQDLLDRLENWDDSNTLQENIKLFDAVIHCEHVNGNIFDIDTEEIKKMARREFDRGGVDAVF